MKLKAVMDTNVLISGVLWRGIPFELLRWAEKDRLVIYTSLEILAEVHRVLHYSKFQKYINSEESSPGELFEKIASLCTIIHPDQEVKEVCSDDVLIRDIISHHYEHVDHEIIYDICKNHLPNLKKAVQLIYKK